MLSTALVMSLDSTNFYSSFLSRKDRVIDADILSASHTLKYDKKQSAYIIGDYAKGLDSGIIDLILIGKINQEILHQLIEKTEKLINRKIRPMILTKKEFKKLNKPLDIEHALPIWG